jgi:hypothetical protein
VTAGRAGVENGCWADAADQQASPAAIAAIEIRIPGNGICIDSPASQNLTTTKYPRHDQKKIVSRASSWRKCGSRLPRDTECGITAGSIFDRVRSRRAKRLRQLSSVQLIGFVSSHFERRLDRDRHARLLMNHLRRIVALRLGRVPASYRR